MDLLSCPNEVLCDIFAQNSISLSDLRHLMLSCRRFLNIIRNSNELWRLKFMARWSQVVFNLQGLKDEVIWLDMVSLRFKVGWEVKETLKDLSKKCYPVGQPPLIVMDNLISNESPIPEFVEDELVELIFQPTAMNENLTSRYYARKVLRYLRCCRLEKQWQELMALPTEQKSLLAGAVLISQWGQMEQKHLTSLSEIESIIDSIAQRVRQVVGEKRSTSEVRSEDPRHVRMMLNCLNQVLYDEMGFQGNKEDYYAPENSYIDRVLQTRRGIPITLCIVYHEVAKRLGIQCEPVSFPQHFLLRWREHPEKEAADSFTYIDAFNGGASHQPRSCPALIGQPRPHIRREAYSAVPAEHVFQRMVNNLIQSARVHEGSRRDELRLQNQLHFPRLACAVSAGQTPSVVAYAELCVFLGVQLEEAIKLLLAENFSDDHPMIDFEPNHWARVRQITLVKCTRKLNEQQAQISQTVECRRLFRIKYAVGLVMKHSYNDIGGSMRPMYKCVIASWDPRCLASDEWVNRMEIHNLARGTDQPFYHVLTEDGSSRYVAEDTLELVPDGCVIHHPDVGLHFQRFDGRRYLPNSEKMANYPEDDAVAELLIGSS